MVNLGPIICIFLAVGSLRCSFVKKKRGEERKEENLLFHDHERVYDLTFLLPSLCSLGEGR